MAAKLRHSTSSIPHAPTLAGGGVPQQGLLVLDEALVVGVHVLDLLQALLDGGLVAQRGLLAVRRPRPPRLLRGLLRHVDAAAAAAAVSCPERE